jgi:hypothetical protein
MKGQISQIQGIILVLVALVVFLLLFTQLSSKKPAEENYLNLPGGINMYLASITPDGGFQKFIGEVPTIGETVVVDGQSVMLPEKGWLGQAKDFMSPILGTEIYPTYTTPIMPTTLMYVLSASGTCGSFDPAKPLGQVTLHMDIDTKKLEDYISEKDNLAFETVSKPETQYEITEKILKKIKINICWDGGTKCYGCDKEDKVCMEKMGSSLAELISSGTCMPEVLENGVGLSFTSFQCDFVLEGLAEKCCPSSVTISTNITVEAKDNNGAGNTMKKAITAQELSPTFVYYFDSASRDELFENSAKILESCFKPKEGKISPSNDLLIYPCRAVVSGKAELSGISDTIKGPSQEDINFEDCDKESITADSLGYRPISPTSGWLCKNTGSGQYYLFNPYAFCRLTDGKLPEIPEVSYLENRIPSESKDGLQLAWICSKAEIDRKYGLAQPSAEILAQCLGKTQTPVETAPSAKDNSKPTTPTQNPPVTVTPTKPQTPATPKSETWTIKTCEGCKNTCPIARDRLTSFSGSSEEPSQNYICIEPYINRGENSKNINSVCYGEPIGCAITLISSSGSQVICTC